MEVLKGSAGGKGIGAIELLRIRLGETIMTITLGLANTRSKGQV